MVKEGQARLAVLIGADNSPADIAEALFAASERQPLQGLVHPGQAQEELQE